MYGERIPGLCTVDAEVRRALSEACAWSGEENERVLNKAAQIVCKDLLVSDEIFDGDVSEKRQSCSAPNSLVKLISMILEGGEPSRELLAGLQKVYVDLSQLIRFNSVKQRPREGTQKIHHSKNNEPPSPLLIGLMVHARTGKRKLVDWLAAEGVSISCDCVMNFRRSISNQVCMEYQANGLVCPVDFEKNVSTTAAIDNLDHNPSSATADSSFHGTTISVFQHADYHLSLPSFRVDVNNSGRRKQSKLPVSHTNIQPTVSGKPEPPVSSEIDPDLFFLDGSASAHPNEWLLKLATEPEDAKDQMSFSAYFSRTSDIVFKTSSHLLPPITEPVTAPATVRHAANMVKAITENVNPGQPVVITADQPVYALREQLQWIFPDEFRDFVCMLGPLHIEQKIGDW